MTTIAEGPASTQAQAIKDLLWSQPRLAAGGELLVAYARQWSRQASWICAYARAAGLTVRLLAVLNRPDSFARQLREQARPDLTIMALTSLDLALPDGGVQLAGLPGRGPIDLWQSQEAVAAAIGETLKRASEQQLTITSGGGAVLTVTPDSAGWQAETGQRGTASVSPAGAIRAGVSQADGDFTADGAIAMNRPAAWDARLAAKPVTISVRDGQVTELDCPDDTLAHFLRRAVLVHHASAVAGIALGARADLGEFSESQGPVNACQGVALRLGVSNGSAYSPASSDLQIDLVARSRP